MHKGWLRLVTDLFKIVVTHEQAGRTLCFLAAVSCVNLYYILTGLSYGVVKAVIILCQQILLKVLT